MGPISILHMPSKHTTYLSKQNHKTRSFNLTSCVWENPVWFTATPTVIIVLYTLFYLIEQVIENNKIVMEEGYVCSIHKSLVRFWFHLREPSQVWIIKPVIYFKSINTFPKPVFWYYSENQSTEKRFLWHTNQVFKYLTWRK